VYNFSWECYGVSPATRDYAVLPATPTQVKVPCLTPARQACTQFVYLRGIKGRVDVCHYVAAESVMV